MTLFQPDHAVVRLIGMRRHLPLAVLGLLLVVVPAQAQQAPSARQIAQERASAEFDAPHLVEVLELKPGMTVGDVGSGGGAMTVVLGKWIGSGHVFATDVTEHALRETRDYVKREGLSNVTVIEGAVTATNLPAACCDAVFLRLVYHHLTAPEPFNKSLLASLKPGGRLAIIDMVSDKGSRLPEGVPANRGGHGVPTAVVIEELVAAGFTHVQTIDAWPPGDKTPSFLVLLRKP